MKFIENSKKLMTFILVAAIVFITTTSTTRAVTNTLVVGDAEDLPTYIGGVTFATKTTTDGKYLYCLEMTKKTTMNTTVNLNGERDAGIAYIIMNGYPTKSFTGDRLKDYYITQTAIWWYLDETTGSVNLGDQFKSTGPDTYNMRHFVKELVDNALNAQKQGYKKTTLKTKVDNNSLTLNGNYYVSNTINVTTNANNYNVSLSGAPKDTKIVGATSNQEGTNISSNEGFIVKVPAKEVKSTELNIKVTVTAANEIYKAYQYTPVDTSMQTVTPAIIEPTVDEVKTEIDLGLITSKVKITKYDITTNNPLPGAKLVLKNEKGEVITSWTSTVNSHVIRNLSDGTYYVSETEAPVGYEKSDEAVKFTINGSENDITVKFYNAPKETTIVNITKIDSETGNSLAGAKMIIKDSEGKEVKQFTSTEESYTITGLPYGTYTLSEIAAPNGYKKSDEVITFTLDDEHISYQIKYANYKEITVPNTKSSSLLFTILGIAIIVSGLGFVYGKTEK